MKIEIITGQTAATVDGVMQDLERGRVVEVSDPEGLLLTQLGHAKAVIAKGQRPEGKRHDHENRS